jgi:cytochrome c oxidase subunit III
METTKTKKIHPHKFALWVAMASIIMAFSGLISAYLVKMSQSNWLLFNLPSIFTISTVVIIASSATMFFAERAFKQRQLPTYRLLITITAILGIIFMVLQVKGFFTTEHLGVKIIGKGANASGSFLGVIAGFHILHVLGGVIILIVQFLRAFNTKNRFYSAVPVEITAMYWHFVDVLWIVLFIFFLIAKPN